MMKSHSLDQFAEYIRSIAHILVLVASVHKQLHAHIKMVYRRSSRTGITHMQEADMLM